MTLGTVIDPKLGGHAQSIGGATSSPPFPEEFDWRYYAGRHEDLRRLTAAQLAEHYEQYGRGEGRCASPAAWRENFVQLIPDREPVLEIGPFFQPVVRGENVRYFDVFGAAELSDRARAHGADPSKVPSVIHYVSATCELSAVPDRFGAVVSSHCIEHQPDLIKHLADVAELLPERGCYFLLIPDKRYCFDHFIAESTVAEVINAHVEQRRVHTLGSVIEHRTLTTHNDSGRHWRGDPVDPDGGATIAERTRIALREFDDARGSYIDVHAWQFTPASFREITSLLCELGYSSMQPVRVYDTGYGRNEFTAILQKAAPAS
jgi:SAM-dependent methyltransferase